MWLTYTRTRCAFMATVTVSIIYMFVAFTDKDLIKMKGIVSKGISKQFIHGPFLGGLTKSNDISVPVDIRSGRQHRRPIIESSMSHAAMQKDEYYQKMIKLFTTAISDIRNEFLKFIRMSNGSHFHELQSPAVTLDERFKEFYMKLKPLTWIKTVGLFIPSIYVLPTDVNVLGNSSKLTWPRVPLYPIYTDQGVCEILLKRTFFLQSCEKHAQLNVSRNPIDRYDEEYTKFFFRWNRIHVHIVPHAVVHKNGYIRTRNVYLVPSMCTHAIANPNQLDDYKLSPLVDEVLVISQFWGGGYFHWNIETFPRVVPYIDFLNLNPTVKIHVPSASSWRIQQHFKIIGISPDRLISGKIRAKVAYVPQGGDCGEKAHPVSLPLLSSMYQQYIRDKILGQTTVSPKKAIVLIQRVKSRRLVQHSEVLSLLEGVAKSKNMELVVFSDKELPTFNETLVVFHRAALVVAPHGAGLANVVFTAPPAAVVEVLCSQIKSVVCYPFLSQNLGHRHFAIRAQSGCDGGLHVDIGKLTVVVNYIAENYL